MDKDLLKFIEYELQLKISKAENVSGGDINQTFVLTATDKKVFLKLNTDDKADMFEKEFKGLELLRNSTAINVPKPLITGKYNKDIFLVMECIEKGTPSPDFWQVFGKALASLHQTTSDKFGLDHDNYIGSLSQPNKLISNWSEFYAEQRILFMIKMVFDAKKCDTSDTRMAERLCGKLDSLFPEEKPVLLHGDLWSGNFMINKDGMPVIYDPAVYYGHREMDIGMTLLFGGFDKTFYDHYNEALPLEKKWQQRIDLTQLYPLLVHLNLFGGHYYNSARSILKKYT